MAPSSLVASVLLRAQVCSYRVLTSYESDKLERFSRCILQKHNCLRNHAEIPVEPAPAPLAKFRGRAMTHELAEDLFIGHLSSDCACSQPFSWRVACGKNPGACRCLQSGASPTRQREHSATG